MKADHLMAFCMVAQEQSISRAAEKLHLSQPAVSKQLSQLQDAVGQSLYERTPYGIRLTRAGEDLLPHACALTRSFDQAKQFALGKYRPQEVTLRVGVSSSLAPHYMPQLLGRAHRYRPDAGTLRLKLVEGYTGTLVREVAERQLDAALVLEPHDPVPDTLVPKRISEDALVLITPPEHRLARLRYTSLTAVQGETLVLPEPLSDTHKRTWDYLARSRIRPERLLEVGSPTAVRSLVMAGCGVGVVLRSFVDAEVAAGLLRVVRLEEDGFIVGIYRLSPRAQGLEPYRRALDALF